ARQSRNGVPTIVVLEGPMGVGKSRLAEEAMRMVRRLDFTVCAGQCWEGFAVPYLGVGPSLFPEVAERLAGDPTYEDDLRALRRADPHGDRADDGADAEPSGAPLHAEDLVLFEHDASAGQVDRLLGALTVAAARVAPLALV